MNRIFPQPAASEYAGWRVAIALLALFTAMKFAQGATSTFFTRFVLSTADAIPLDKFDAHGAETVVLLFALLGLYVMLFCLPTVVVLLRFRALIPLMYVLWLIEEGAKLAVLTWHPISRSAAVSSGTMVNRVLLGLLLIGFVFSLLPRSTTPRQNDDAPH